MIYCAYHPGAAAEFRCERCGKPICEKDQREYLKLKGRAEKDLYEKFIFCPFCYQKVHKSDLTVFIVLAVVTPVAIAVMVLLKIQIAAVVITGVFLMSAVVLLAVRAFLDKKWIKTDIEKFLKGIARNNPGDADVPVNRLLGFSPEEMTDRAAAIYNEIREFGNDNPVFRIYLRKDRWTFHDLGRALLQFKKDIVYWSWRNDLSESNINRTALVFAYLLAASHYGKEHADSIIETAPPEMIAPGVMKKLLD